MGRAEEVLTGTSTPTSISSIHTTDQTIRWFSPSRLFLFPMLSWASFHLSFPGGEAHRSRLTRDCSALAG